MGVSVPDRGRFLRVRFYLSTYYYVTQGDMVGMTPLHHAAGEGHLNVIEWLVDAKGADITQGDEYQISFIMGV